MAASTKVNKLKNRRKYRVRQAIREKSNRIRCSVLRTNKHLHVQFIDDNKGQTLASASTLNASLKLKSGSNIDAAEKVGELAAKQAKAAGIETIVFDRGAYLYHGRVKAFADALRKAGIKF